MAAAARPGELVTSSKTHVRLAAGVWVDVREGLADPDVCCPRPGPRRRCSPICSRTGTTTGWTPSASGSASCVWPSWSAAASGCSPRAATADGIQVGLRAAAMEPLRESSHRLVIRCHLAEGNLVEAIRQYEWFAALLCRELGATPSARMADLIDTGARSRCRLGA